MVLMIIMSSKINQVLLKDDVTMEDVLYRFSVWYGAQEAELSSS